MKIAICDDNPQDIVRLVQLIRMWNISTCLDTYACAESLLSAYASGSRYDIIFMDIQMEGINGFSAAKILRRTYADKKRPLIAFATVSCKYSQNGYAVARAYLTKPFTGEEVLETLTRLHEELGCSSIHLKQGKDTHIVQLENIMYAEIKNYTLIIRTASNSDITTRMPIDEFYAKLPSTLFLQPHRSFVVACRCILKYNSREVHMLDNKVIPVSRSFYDSLKKGIQSYLRGDNE